MRLPSASTAMTSKPARAFSATEPSSKSGRMPIITSRVRTGMSTVLSVVRPPGSWIEILIIGLQRQRRVGEFADVAGRMRSRRRHRSCGTVMVMLTIGEGVVDAAELIVVVIVGTASVSDDDARLALAGQAATPARHRESGSRP